MRKITVKFKYEIYGTQEVDVSDAEYSAIENDEDINIETKTLCEAWNDFAERSNIKALTADDNDFDYQIEGDDGHIFTPFMA